MCKFHVLCNHKSPVGSVLDVDVNFALALGGLMYTKLVFGASITLISL